MIESVKRTVEIMQYIGHFWGYKTQKGAISCAFGEPTGTKLEPFVGGFTSIESAKRYPTSN